MRKIRIAQIGISANSHGRHVFKSLEKQKDVFDIVGYALPENEDEKFPEQVECLKPYKRMTVDEILADESIEAVTIETEEIYLTKYALMAANAGKHIHMEKPGGISLADFEVLIDTMKNTGKVFHTGYMYRYNPYVKQLISKIKMGELGKIVSVEAQMNCYHLKEVKQWLDNFPGGMMFFLGCHLVDLVLQIMGTPEKIVSFNKCTNTDDVTAVDYGFAVFEYKNGVAFVKTHASEFGGFIRRQLVVTGTKGTIELKPFEILQNDVQYTDKTEYYDADWHTPGLSSRSDAYDRYDDMLKSFASMVCGEMVNPYTLDYELTLYKAVLKACGN